MRSPVVVVTGPIASGKTTVARVIAARGGAVIDCDALAHRALDLPAVRRRLVAAFGSGVLAPSGRISRRRLARAVFADEAALAALNRIVRPAVRRAIAGEVSRRRRRSAYIVLDAVLYFQYTFPFKVDFVIATSAPRSSRIARMMERDSMTRAEARRRIERQKAFERDWARADETIATGRPLAAVRRDAGRIRDGFLGGYGISRRKR